MKSLFFLSTLFLSALVSFGQLENLKYDISYYKDEVNGVIYVGGITEESKYAVVKLDEDFNVLASLTTSFTKDKKTEYETSLLPPDMYVSEWDNENSKISFNEELELGEFKFNNEQINLFNSFNKGKYVYVFKDSTAYSNNLPLVLTCYEKLGFELKLIWEKNIGIQDQTGIKILDVSDEFVYFYDKKDNTNFVVFQYNLKVDKVFNSKNIKVDYTEEITVSEIKYDKYRQHIYIGFTENIGNKREDNYANISLFVLDKDLNEVFNPVVKNNVYSKKECIINTAAGKIEYDFKYTDNKPMFIVSSSGVNMQVLHALRLKSASSSSNLSKQSNNIPSQDYSSILGITDISVINNQPQINYYNQQSLMECYNNFKPLNKGTLIISYYRDKVFYKGGSIYMIPKTYKDAQKNDKSSLPIVYMDLLNKVNLKVSENVKLDYLDLFVRGYHSDILYNYSKYSTNLISKMKPFHFHDILFINEKSFSIPSANEEKVLWFYVTEVRYNKATDRDSKFSYAIDTLE